MHSLRNALIIVGCQALNPMKHGSGALAMHTDLAFTVCLAFVINAVCSYGLSCPLNFLPKVCVLTGNVGWTKEKVRGSPGTLSLWN